MVATLYESTGSDSKWAWEATRKRRNVSGERILIEI